MEPITTGAIVAGVASLAGSAVNAYQTHKERKRQRELDEYNKELTERNYQQQELYNSPSYQKQLLMEAGYNPIVSGDSPSMGAPSSQPLISTNPVPTSTIGDSIVKGMGDLANTLLTQKQREIELQGLEVEAKKIAMEKYKIETEYMLSVAEKATQLYHNKSITKEQYNGILSSLNLSVNGKSLTSDEIESRINVNNQNVLESKERANLTHIDSQTRSEYNNLVNKKLDAETKRQLIENLYAPMREMLTNRKIEWDGKNGMRTFEKIGAETDSVKLDSYKKELDNFVLTTSSIIENISPGTILPANVQESVVDFVIDNYSSVLGTMLNDVKDSLNIRRSHRRSMYGYGSTSFREKIEFLQELTDKAIEGSLTKQELWYLSALLGVGKDAVTIPLRR